MDLAYSARKPEFWSYSAWLDIATKYRRSRLGILWLLIPTAFYVWGVGPFFAGLQNRSVGSFVAHVGVGYLLFRLVLMVISESAGVVTAQQAFILDGRTRLTDFVLRVVVKAIFYLVMSLPVILPALVMTDFGSRIEAAVFAILGLLLVILNCIWIGCVVALIGARFPDLQEFTTSLFILAFVFTPIIWHASDAPPGTYRGLIMHLNPLYHLIEVVRAPIMSGSSGISWLVVILMTLSGWLLASIMYRRYVRAVPLWI